MSEEFLFCGLSCHRGDLGPVASAAVVHAGRWEGDDPVLAFVALAVLLSFWLSALYRAGGCAFSCCLLHALANTLIGVLSLSSISLVMAAVLALTGLSLAAFCRRLPIEEV